MGDESSRAGALNPKLPTPIASGHSGAGGVPPHLPTDQAVGVEAPPSSVRQLLLLLLNAFLVVFLVDGVVSLLDDSLILLFDVHLLASLRGVFFLLAFFLTAIVYLLMGLTPQIPKRLILPLALFNPVALLVTPPLLIYFFHGMERLAWGISLCQVLFGAVMLLVCLRGRKLRWPLIADSCLGDRRFSWLNLGGFVLVNGLVLLPGVVAYLILCVALAVDHFSDGFVVLRPEGLVVRVRTYVRDDGKEVQLFPMSHIGDASFYTSIARSFPSNSIILMEGVSDRQNLLTNKISYERMASSLGLAEQKEEFEPLQGELVRADVDVAEFSTETIDFLNLVMLVHAKDGGMESLLHLLSYTPPPGFEKKLMKDLLTLRNQHLVEELFDRLSETEDFIVPWGAAHMPGIAQELQKRGFRLKDTRDQVAIHFRLFGRPGRRVADVDDH